MKGNMSGMGKLRKLNSKSGVQRTGDICLHIFIATKFYEVFSGKQLCQDIKILQCFGDGVSPQNVEEFYYPYMTACPIKLHRKNRGIHIAVFLIEVVKFLADV
jgi:hypothetical protein